MTARTADTVSADLYDLPRDLEPHEVEFRAEVGRIGRLCTETIGIAARATGPNSTVTLAIRMTATARRDERFAALLAKFDTIHADIMENA